MYFSSVITSALLLAGAALAQKATGTPTYSTTGTTSVPDKGTKTGTGMVPTGNSVGVTVVNIGNKDGAQVIEPNSLQVEVGSMIQFHFYPQNHSVVRSNFDQPCKPIELSQPGSKGFFSGFMPVKDKMGIFTIWVTDKNPIWFYCSQGKHCQGGMVGVINPPASNSSRNIDTFKALAAKAPANISPSGNHTNGNSGSSGPTSSVPSAPIPTASTAKNASSNGTTPAPASDGAAGHVGVGGLMAIVVLGMALLA